MFWKEAFGFVATGCAVMAYVVYIWSIFKRRTKPHAFSWIVWGLLMTIVAMAQLSEGAGAGAWATVASAAACVLITGLAIARGEKDITKSDWVIFTGALITVPVWYFTKDPLAAVILATAIDVLGFYPTFRKSWHRPHEENFFMYVMGVPIWIFSLLALDRYATVTVFYPAFLLVANGGLAAMLLWRLRARAAD